MDDFAREAGTGKRLGTRLRECARADQYPLGVASTLPADLLSALRECAKESAEKNYSRYSGFLVVAVVEDTDGVLFGGSNVEVANSCGSCRQFAFEWVAEDARCVIDAGRWKPATVTDRVLRENLARGEQIEAVPYQ